MLYLPTLSAYIYITLHTRTHKQYYDTQVTYTHNSSVHETYGAEKGHVLLNKI